MTRGWTYLLLCAACSVTFVQLLRFGQRRGADTLAIITVNYGIAAIVSALLLCRRPIDWGEAIDGKVFLLAGINGVFYLVHLLLILMAYRHVGVGITTAMGRAGIIIPAVVAWLLWDEPMTPLRWVALALVPVAMLLMRRPEPGKPSLSLRGDLVLGACFLGSGIILSIHKVAEAELSPDQREVYKTGLFVFAFLASLGYALATRVRFGRTEIVLGALIGAGNALALLFILLGLAVMPATVFFPTSSSIEICLNVAVSRLLWQERFLRRQLVGLALAVGIVLLTNR